MVEGVLRAPLTRRAALLAPLAAAIALSCSGTALAAFPGRDGVIAFRKTDAHRNTTIWTVDPRTRRQRQLTRVPASCARLSAGWLDDVPAFTRTGRYVYFGHSGGCGRDGLYRVPAAGGAPKRVLADGSNRITWWPTPTTFGKLLFINDLAISKRRDPDEFDDTIHSVPLGGGRTRRLSPRGATSDEFPAVSASGKLVFSRDRRSLMVGRAGRFLPRRGLRKLVGLRRGAFATSDWSPGGGAVVFERQRPRPGFHSDVFTIGANGRGLRRLTHTDKSVSPVFSPSGHWIAYAQSPESHPTRGALYVVDRTGRHRRKILASVDEIRLSWQPLPRRRR